MSLRLKVSLAVVICLLMILISVVAASCVSPPGAVEEYRRGLVHEKGWYLERMVKVEYDDLTCIIFYDESISCVVR